MPATKSRRARLLDKCSSNAIGPWPRFLKIGRIGRIGSYRNSTKTPAITLATPQQPVSQPHNTTVITSRVYILALEDPTRVTIKEVMYVDLSASTCPFGWTGSAADGRPFWVPDYVLWRNWCQDPPCYWKTDSVAMQDLRNAKLMYNPMSDYSLEIIRWYRPDIFEVLFQRFCFRSKWSHNSHQLDLLKDTIKPQCVPVDDFDANFSPNSPAAVTLEKATMPADFLPVVDHYMALLSVRAFCLRDTLMLIR